MENLIIFIYEFFVETFLLNDCLSYFKLLMIVYIGCIFIASLFLLFNVIVFLSLITVLLLVILVIYCKGK